MHFPLSFWHRLLQVCVRQRGQPRVRRSLPQQLHGRPASLALYGGPKASQWRFPSFCLYQTGRSLCRHQTERDYPRLRAGFGNSHHGYRDYPNVALRMARLRRQIRSRLSAIMRRRRRMQRSSRAKGPISLLFCPLGSVLSASDGHFFLSRQLVNTPTRKKKRDSCTSPKMLALSGE